MTNPDANRWLDPKEDVTADNGHTTSASPEFDSPTYEPGEGQPPASPNKAKHRKK